MRSFLDQVLKRMWRCVITGHVRFTFKAELEMLGDDLSRTDVLESVMNARAISKVVRSRRAARKGGGEHLYVIQGLTYDNILVYTKGKLQRESGEEVYYILISSKRSVEG